MLFESHRLRADILILIEAKSINRPYSARIFRFHTLFRRHLVQNVTSLRTFSETNKDG